MRGWWIAVAAVLCAPALAHAGELGGVVLEKATYQPLFGVTAVVTSPQLQAMPAAITDEQGRYRFVDLPPGVYTVTFYYDDISVQRHGLVVAAQGATYANTLMPEPTIGCTLLWIQPPPIVPNTAAVEYVIHGDQVATDHDVQSDLSRVPQPPAGVTRAGATRQIHGLRLPAGAAPLSDALFDEIDVHQYGYRASIGGSTGPVIDLSPRSGSNHTRGFVRARGGRRAADGAAALAGPLRNNRAWYSLVIAPRADHSETAASALAEVNVAVSPEQQGWALAIADRARPRAGDITRLTRGAAVGWLSRFNDNRLELEAALGRFSTSTTLPGATARTDRHELTLAARDRFRAWGIHQAELGASGAREVTSHPDIKRRLARDERAAWIDDAWSLSPALLASAGVRWESERVADAVGTRTRGGLSPRLGLTYDWTDEGRARLFGSWGRYRDPARGLALDTTVAGAELALTYNLSLGAAYVRRGRADGGLLTLRTRGRFLRGIAEYRFGQRDPVTGTHQTLEMELLGSFNLCFARDLFAAAGLRFGAGEPSYLAVGKRWKLDHDPVDVSLQLADLTGSPALQLAAQVGF